MLGIVSRLLSGPARRVGSDLNRPMTGERRWRDSLISRSIEVGGRCAGRPSTADMHGQMVAERPNEWIWRNGMVQCSCSPLGSVHVASTWRRRRPGVVRQTLLPVRTEAQDSASPNVCNRRRSGSQRARRLMNISHQRSAALVSCRLNGRRLTGRRTTRLREVHLESPVDSSRDGSHSNHISRLISSWSVAEIIRHEFS